MQFLTAQLMCMLLVSYDLFVINNYSQKYYVLQQKISGHLDGMTPSICQTLAYMTT